MVKVFIQEKVGSKLACINTSTILKPGYYSSYLPAYEDGTECSGTSAYKIQTPGNYPEENVQHSQHGESLKSKCYLLKYLQEPGPRG
jgi:hypothetical protein